MKESAEPLDAGSEIYSINTDGGDLRRLTHNDRYDGYPAFAPDGSAIAFLSLRNRNLSLYAMDAEGGGQRRLYDSGGHDADVHWGRGGILVFTRDHQLWSVNPDGSDPRQLTDPAGAGEWGSANLPIGDYDPRFSPDGSRIVFARLEDPHTTHGGYNLFTINADGTGETRLTDNGYTQGMPSWSQAGDRIVYVVSAIGGRGQYRMYVIKPDGTGNRGITPAYFPAAFLCRQAIFSGDDAGIIFVGQWWD